MNRRSFFKLKSSGNTRHKNHVVGRTSSGITPYTGIFSKNEVVHLLKRTMFGAKPSDIAHFSSLSIDAAVDELLTITSPLPAPPVKDYDTGEAEVPDNNVAPGTTWVNDTNIDLKIGGLRKTSFKRWWVGVMLDQPRNIREKMALFWHNHFATESAATNDGRFVYKHHTMLREQCLGNFKALARMVTIDPLMLVYQNGDHNTKGQPDENFARELQELFTLGKENNPNYTEDDVKAAARVLTGWRNNEDTTIPYFDPQKHDTGNKQFSSFYNNTIIVGRTGETAGDQELDDLINMIFSKGVEASVYIVKELYRWFVYYEIDEAAQANVIEPLALLLRNSNWEIKPVLSTLLKSDHFFDPLNQGCLIKSPVDFAIGLCREMNVQFPSTADYLACYSAWELISYQLYLMQQTLGDPPSVSGWPAYYQIPTFHELWINNDTYPRRTQFSDSMVYLGYSRNEFDLIVDTIAFARALSNPSDPNVLLAESLDILYRLPLSAATQQQIKQDILLTGQTNDIYWTNAWNDYVAKPSDMVAYQTIHSRLSELYKYLLALPEYQLS